MIKYIIITIIRHISFYNKDFMTSHYDIIVDKKSDSPVEDKYVHDSKLLIPTLKDFFSKHPLINPKTFPSNATFDTAALYSELLTGNTLGDNKHFVKAYIPLNSRSGFKNQDYSINKRAEVLLNYKMKDEDLMILKELLNYKKRLNRFKLFYAIKKW